MVEYCRGLYRYPHKMIGRELVICTSDEETDVLVLAAHPDDDVLGLCSTLYRHRMNGDRIKIVFVTNGTAGKGESWHLKTKHSRNKANVRYMEAVSALSQINIKEDTIFCLGFPDGGTQRYLQEISMDIMMLMEKLNPKRVYVHCIEGGHVDHDITSFIVKSICNKTGYVNLYEWAEYNPSQPIGTRNIQFFNPNKYSMEQSKVEITEQERVLKRKMLALHKSQDVEQYYMQGEAIRKADSTKLEEELYEYCELSKRRLTPLVAKYYKSIS